VPGKKCKNVQAAVDEGIVPGGGAALFFGTKGRYKYPGYLVTVCSSFEFMCATQLP
jgi:hypothetical protein